MDIHVVSHTHWDREWYHDAGRFRQRLVRLIDELLDRPSPDGSGSVPAFLLDGQAVVIDDYLAVRPERRDELATALVAGRLEAGPWYVLADGLIPSGESLLRNLLAGRAVLSALGATSPPVLYCPDAFGHSGALPAIAEGFSMPLAIVWRGYGSSRWPAGDAVWWRARGGERVLLYHLARDGYELGSNLPTDEARVRARWESLRAALIPRARLGAVLLPNGADHHALQGSAPAAVSALAAAADGHRVHWGSLREFSAAAIQAAPMAELPVVDGELRDSYGFTWTLQGTLATRAHQKRDAAIAERALLRDVEPWLAQLIPQAGAAGRALLDAAWRTLLLCHPHDTLCGCSTDQVARAMDARLESVRSQARGLRASTLHSLLGHDPVVAREHRDRWQHVLAVRNRAVRRRGGVAEVELLTFVAREPVGPGSSAIDGRSRKGAVTPLAPVDAGDNRLLVQSLGQRMVRHLTESPRHYPVCDRMLRERALVWLPPVDGLGVATFSLQHLETETAPASAPVHPVMVGERSLDNGLLHLSVDERGGVTLTTAEGRTFRDLLAFEDVGDAGDCYTHSPVGSTSIVSSAGRVRVGAAGPLRGMLRLDYTLRPPARRSRGRESARRVPCSLRVALSLDADSDLLRIAIRGVNRARDHRLRLVIRTGVHDTGDQQFHFADAAFGEVHRSPIVQAPEEEAVELAVRTAPLHRYVSLYGADEGVTVLSDGLAEYEASGSGDVSVTLLRAVGQLSRNSLPERPGHAGWPGSTPAAQCIGAFAANLALVPHGARGVDSIARIQRSVDDFLFPLRGESWCDVVEPIPAAGGIELDGDGLAVSAIRPATDDRWRMVLRCVNLLDVPVEGAWRLRQPVTSATIAALDETPGQAIEIVDGRIPFTAGGGTIVTILVR